MSLTLTFFALDSSGNEQVLRRSVIPDEMPMVYQSSPEVALTIVQNSGLSRPDGFRITDGQMRVRASFTQGRPSPPQP